MLKELKDLKFPGGKKDILFFLQNVVGEKKVSLDDAKIICSHSPGNYQLSVDNLLDYCLFFGWVKMEPMIYVDEAIKPYLHCTIALNDKIVSDTVGLLFELGIFNSSLFSFNTNEEKFIFNNDEFPLSFSNVRNTLANQGFFIIKRNIYTLFFINCVFEDLIFECCKIYNKKMSLLELRKIIEKNNEIGEKAELFVLEFEKDKFVNHKLYSRIRIISEVDVGAGYDIISFDSKKSIIHDKFIEVKALSSKGFYWSNNELRIAKIKGEQYHLYLVDINRIGIKNYKPTIITNPADTITSSSEWLIEPQNYFVRKI